ncbi:MAG TPA: thioredoxin family protein [Longimicrobium sp.]|jgi:hypothetical protein|uniref:thioredoxin family protein n=1 Tax=Longimicrobium sp. TaxID=2029185 RepID=UPI002EDB4D6F
MTDISAGPDLWAYWEGAFSWDDYLNREVQKNAELWKSLYQRASVPVDAVQRAAEIGGSWRILVISEDWCGDAFNTVPVMARLAEAVPGIELRVVKRDENLELMDAFLTNGSRSIPVAIVLRHDDTVAGHWGPRPPELQTFVLAEKRKGERPVDDIYRDVRTWYARDKGHTTVRQILDILAAG